MLQAIAQARRRPFKSVVADCLDGTSPDFLEALAAGGGLSALVAIAAEPGGWRQRPQTAEQTDKETQEARVKRVVMAAMPAADTVAAVAARRPAARW